MLSICENRDIERSISVRKIRISQYAGNDNRASRGIAGISTSIEVGLQRARCLAHGRI